LGCRSGLYFPYFFFQSTISKHLQSRRVEGWDPNGASRCTAAWLAAARREGTHFLQIPPRRSSLSIVLVSEQCLSAELGTHAKEFWCLGGPVRFALDEFILHDDAIENGEQPPDLEAVRKNGWRD